MVRVRVKVCCISSPDEARLAITAGADAIGLVGEMPSGPGVIDDRLIAEIAERIPPPVTPILLTSRTDGAGIAEHAARCGVSTVQIVDHIDRDEHQRARRALPGLRLLQVIHVTGPEALDLAGGLNAANVADAVRQVRPFAVDLCSGVRHQDILDPDRLAAFFDAVATA